MASKRHQRRKACEGKIRFTDHLAAERAASSHVRKYHEWMRAYRCKFCSGFHVGHPPRHVRQAIIARREGT